MMVKVCSGLDFTTGSPRVLVDAVDSIALVIEIVEVLELAKQTNGATNDDESVPYVSCKQPPC